MTIKHLSVHLGLGFALATFAVVAQTSTAQAQTGNQSDTTGAIVTTSDIAGGAFRFDDNPEREGLANQNAVNDVAGSVNQQLVSRTLRVVATDSPTPISATVQENLAVVVTNTGNVDAAAARLSSALANACGNPASTQNLVSSMVGLTAGGGVNPQQFLQATRAYNAFVNDSSGGCLSNPPDELRAIRSILAQLLNAALASG